MSVTAPKVPRVVVRATTPPLVVRLLPLASFSCTVMVDVVVPSARMLVGLAVIVEVVREAEPAVKATVAVSVIALLAKVPLIVAVPTVLAEVKVAV